MVKNLSRESLFWRKPEPMRCWVPAALALICGLMLVLVPGHTLRAQPRASEGVGALLYESNCQSCHTAQVHWRERKQATDFNTLVAQVNRWQGNLGLRWSAQDIDEVSRYLNRRYYQFGEPAKAWHTRTPAPG